MPVNLNDAAEQKKFGDLIPDGAYVKLVLNLKPGGHTMQNQDPMDVGLFKQSKSSDAIGLDCEFTVLEPKEYEHRKLFAFWTVGGGQVDEKGVSKGWNITKATLRAMVESATGTDPKDESPQAKANRQIGGFKQLDNCPFYAKVRTEPGNENPDRSGTYYADKTVLDFVVTPSDPEYAAMRAGSPWPAPKPRNAPHAPAAAAKQPAWGGGASPAASPPAAAKPAWQSGQTQSAPTAAPATTAAPAAPAGPAWLRQ
jgi:hypothetical protein